jgi:hypothetical protein
MRNQVKAMWLRRLLCADDGGPETFVPRLRTFTAVVPSADSMVLRLTTVLEKSLLWDNLFSFNERSRCFHSCEESGPRFSRVRAGLGHTHKNQCTRHGRRAIFHFLGWAERPCIESDAANRAITICFPNVAPTLVFMSAAR